MKNERMPKQIAAATMEKRRESSRKRRKHEVEIQVEVGIMGI
jgi:hypothetical protein